MNPKILVLLDRLDEVFPPMEDTGRGAAESSPFVEHRSLMTFQDAGCKDPELLHPDFLLYASPEGVRFVLPHLAGHWLRKFNTTNPWVEGLINFLQWSTVDEESFGSKTSLLTGDQWRVIVAILEFIAKTDAAPYRKDAAELIGSLGAHLARRNID